ncbi:TSSK6-activating co-chaperone protein isoform X2 [Acomys russatus]|uniref:TSSK6-activating co-chaperone protein isoform X2 n=1 Tax=Acomys russatus TaxID=60746 RepID=UPI0021E28976|nr:TSSK6-activating co-chaperone protein isoform X2 [Acomys russatus]
MEQHTSQPGKKPAQEEDNAVCLCPAKPSPSYINLQANSLPATFLNIQTTKLPSAAQKPKDCPELLQCVFANLQLQTQLAQRQMAILKHLQASLSQVDPGTESKNCAFLALYYHLLSDHLPQFHK